MGAGNTTDRGDMPLLHRMLIGGQYDQCLAILDTARIFQQRVDITVMIPITVKRLVQREFELREPTVERYAGDAGLIAEHQRNIVRPAQRQCGEHTQRIGGNLPCAFSGRAYASHLQAHVHQQPDP